VFVHTGFEAGMLRAGHGKNLLQIADHQRQQRVFPDGAAQAACLSDS
jgi:hypothetical protein